MNYCLLQSTEANISTRVEILRHIRAAEIKEATTNLENLLDGDLITVAALARNGAKFNDKTRSALEIEHTARMNSGYEPESPEIRNEVQEAFRVLAAGSTM
jgi:hypothetical protein